MYHQQQRSQAIQKNLRLLFVGVLPLFFALTLLAAENENQNVGTFPDPTEVTSRDDWKPHVGLIAGFANPEGRFQAAAEYGLDIGFQPYIPFGLGVELSTSSNERKEGPITEDLTRTKVLARGTYNFGGGIPVISDSYFGLGVGPIFESRAGSDEVHLGLSPIVGFDIPLRKRARDFMSLGANAKYLISSGGGPDTLTVAGMLKYWF